MTRCERHSVLNCALCSGRRTPAGQIAMNGGRIWSPGEVRALLEVCGPGELKASDPLFESLALRFGRSARGTFDQWQFETGRVDRTLKKT